MSDPSAKLCCVPSSPPSSQPPPWGERLRLAREARGRSARAVALSAGIAGTYWSQVERGRKKVDPQSPRVKPSRQMLALMAETLHLPDRERAALMAEAGYADLASATDSPRMSPSVNLGGLKRRDLVLLQAIADRLRDTSAEATVTPIKRQPMKQVEPDLRVARKRGKDARPLDEDENWDG
jgi:transcriptional regulator with XRE-family HTH domain